MARRLVHYELRVYEHVLVATQFGRCIEVPLPSRGPTPAPDQVDDEEHAPREINGNSQGHFLVNIAIRLRPWS
jgi:hypothetical protein